MTCRIYNKSYNSVPGRILLLWLNFNGHQYCFILRTACFSIHSVCRAMRNLPSNFCSVAFSDKTPTTHFSYLPQSKENSQKLSGIKLSALPWAIIIAIMTVIFTFWKDNKKIKIHVLTSNWHPHIIHPWLLTINLHKMLLRLLNCLFC